MSLEKLVNGDFIYPQLFDKFNNLVDEVSGLTINSGTTVNGDYLPLSSFTSYSANTLNLINEVSGTTQNQLNTKLNITDFNGYSGSTTPYNPSSSTIGNSLTLLNQPINTGDTINVFANKTQGQIDAIKTYQDETYDYLERIKLAGGRISDYDLSVIDEVVCRGKSDGWFTKLKSFWIPVGDFEASKIFLTTPTGVTPVFYNFVSTDYNINTGYALSTNTNKYIDTFFIPNNNGVTANNITIGMTSLRPYGTSGDGLGFIVGTDNTGAVRGYPFIDESTGALGSDTNNRGGRTNPSYGSSLMLTSNGTKTSTFFNGVLATEHNENLTAAQTNKITIFRNYRENANTYYSNGGVGAFFIGTALTNTEVLSLQFTLEFINAKIRNLKDSDCLVVFGDSVSAGQAAGPFPAVYNVNRYSTLLSQRLGLREFNVSQPSRKVNGVLSNAVDGITSYLNLLKANKTHCIVALSVNDVVYDPSLATTGTLATYNAVQSSLTTMLTNLKTYGYLTVCMGTYNLTTAGATCMANYTLACANAAVASGSLFIDPYRLFVDTGSPATYMADTVHPNIAGHSLIAKTAGMIIRTNKLYRRPLIAGTTVNAGTSYTVDVTVLCSQLGAGVQVQLEDIPDGLILQNAYVQATNNIRIVIFNPTGGNIVLPNTYANIFVDKTY